MFAMALGKRHSIDPSAILSEAVSRWSLDNTAATINRNCLEVTIQPEFYIERLSTPVTIEQTDTPQRVLVDFSSPNIAKDLHVGHLRSTIIGDSVARLMERKGHRVSRINHVGDFGTQFGMLLQWLDETDDEVKWTTESLQRCYQNARKRFDTDPSFAKKSLEKVCLLQSGDPDSLEKWERICEASRTAYREIYSRLEIEIEDVGESYYRDKIPSLVDELKENNVLTIDSKGRTVAFTHSNAPPLMVLKSDGAYTYDTTDLAAIRYRTQDLGMDKIYYVVDNGQSLHFQQVFNLATKMKWVDDKTDVQHLGFGLVLGEDGGRIKTRSGDTVKLIDLLDEGVDEARKQIEKHDVRADDPLELAKRLAYGAIKYSDLRSKRHLDYRYSLSRMLSFEGDTAVYLLYTYARINGILRNSLVPLAELEKVKPELVMDDNVEHRKEMELAANLLRFNEVVNTSVKTLQLHNLCGYLYQLSRCFGSFFTHCRCLEFEDNADGEKVLVSVNHSRLLLCLRTHQTMTHLFDLLGIQTIDKM